MRPLPHAPVSAPLEWDELPDTDPRELTVRTMPARFARLGDLHAEINEVAHDLSPLLEWFERDERDHGLGDMPYPPDYPKMPGEPMRVAAQPGQAAGRGGPRGLDASAGRPCNGGGSRRADPWVHRCSPRGWMRGWMPGWLPGWPPAPGRRAQEELSGRE